MNMAWRRALPWLVVTLLLQAMVLFMAAGITRYRLRQAAFIQQARVEILLDLAEQGVRAHMRPGPSLIVPGVETVFEALHSLPEVAGLRLVDAAGTTLLSTGVPGTPGPHPSPDLERFTRDITDLPAAGMPGRGAPRGPGHGPRWMESRGPDTPWRPLPPGPLIVELWLDRGEDNYVWQVRRDGWLIALGGMLAAAVAVLAVAASRRQRRMRQDLVQAQEEVARQARLARLGAGLAHEIKNPLGVARGLAQSILDSAPLGSPLAEKAAALMDETDRTARRINLFLRYARPPEPRPEPVNLGELGQTLERLLRDEAARQQVRLTVQLEGGVLADADLLRRALMNLLLNALKACGKPGDSIILKVEPETRDTVALAVVDTGTGIDPEDLPRVTEPFFGKFEQGTGLGLSIVQEIARAHGWRLSIRSVPGQGTEVRLCGVKRVSLPMNAMEPPERGES
ncbi:MAG TPA: HAMP domain-containing sensor histidine kinase [Candidatus Hydrogenedentes bacterium]|nr:HAMP domain-containing sensor histidine kinase [Candidatus Hydrogenedentota bacterium]